MKTLILASLLFTSTLFAQSSASQEAYSLQNEKVKYSVVLRDSQIASDRLEATPAWRNDLHLDGSRSIETSADFSFEVMWTDWQAPNKINNAENPVTFTKKDFHVIGHEEKTTTAGGKELDLFLHNNDIPLLIRVSTVLDANAFYIHRTIAVEDTAKADHFLQKFSPIDQKINDSWKVLNTGGFGQPVAVQGSNEGAFFGEEYPAADNSVRPDSAGLHISCGSEMGELIKNSWLVSEPAVEGLSPDPNVKLWFMKYVDDIRVVPLKPFVLYNSWYDLRSPEYPHVPEANVMNETNIRRIIGLIDKNMIEKHSIHLDAFVLDDGWDTYESDWVLRKPQFPNGLKPIVDELKKTDTRLGMWFGPTGGYSFRMKRIDWMKAHGYEVVGTTRNTAMMCLAGTHYSDLFEKRVTNFVGNDGVGYFKWDGIQFSCSEPDHGHPVGIYSRRAVMESLIHKVQAVRAKDPSVFLNITSGTWLSPWWVKYANTIWMQGADYGYADVPSISPRDAAITYRDFVLYDDFKNQNQWFPIANLMTHGIIKGNLEMLGGKEEPLDKFTNEVLLYFARGVAMWELYISPDILNDGEWDALGQAMQWARDRFPTLTQTEMIGGDPTKGQTYGYVHYKDAHGVIAVRNPLITENSLRVPLASSLGFDPNAKNLVLEKVYPGRWISPQLYSANDSVQILLNGYETAIYELYPLADAKEPLLAGVPFDVASNDNGKEALYVYGSMDEAKLLNKDAAKMETALSGSDMTEAPVESNSIKFSSDKGGIDVGFITSSSVKEGMLSILLTPASDSPSKKPPRVHLTIDGVADTAKHERAEDESPSLWYTARLSTGKHEVTISVESKEQGKHWIGNASVWMVCKQQQSGRTVTLTTTLKPSARILPPQALPAGIVVKNVKLGEGKIGSQ